jgi:hypothetical protein
VLASPSAKTKTGCRKVLIEYLLKHQVHALANDSIHHHRYPQFPQLRSPFLRNQCPSGRSKTVCAAFELLVDKFQKFLLASLKRLYRHPVYPRCSGVAPYLSPRQAQSSRFIDPLDGPLLFHFSHSVTLSRRSGLPGYGASRRNRIAFLAYPPLQGLLVPSPITLPRLPSLSPITFRPRLPMSRLTLSVHPGLVSSPSRASGQLCVLRRKRRVLCLIPPSSPDPFPVARVLSSTLLPGFFGPGSSVLPVNLPPSAPSAASGSPPRLQFYGSYHHCSRASPGKTHHLSISRPTSPWFSSPDIRSCLPTRARPPPHGHLAGSLFATYMDSASCFLRTPRFR